MVLVRFIDRLVMLVQIMAGHRPVNPVLLAALWIALSSLVIAGIATVGGLLVLLRSWLATL